MENPDTTVTDISDAALAGMDDTKLLELMEKLGLDTATISSREAALAGIVSKRDATSEAAAAATEAQDPAPLPGVIDTTADTSQPEPEQPPQQRSEPKRARDMVAKAVREAVGNPVAHAALHGFEVALTDFRRAADLMADAKLDPESEVARLIEDVRRYF